MCVGINVQDACAISTYCVIARTCCHGMMADQSSGTSGTVEDCDPGQTDPTTSTAVISVEPQSILSRLLCPEPAKISKEKVKKNKSALAIGNKQSVTPSRSRHNPKSSSPHQRVREFPGENFTVSAGKLFCSGCREELGLKVSIIQLHVKSRKHQAGNELHLRSEAHERDIATSFAQYNQQEHTSGETLPKDMQVYRIRVVTVFLKVGITLNKLENFRDLLEENGQQLAGRRSLSDLIPFIHQEVSHVRSELEGKKVSVIFDRTTQLGEAMVIVLPNTFDVGCFSHTLDTV